MAGTQVNLYSQLDSNILEMQLTLDQTRKSLHAVSLTNYDNTSLPAIAAGSVIEVDGALYKFASEEAIGGSPSDGTVYIKIIPSTITAEFTNTAPTWSDSKQGYYGTGASVTHRYLEFTIIKTSAVYIKSGKKLRYYKFQIGSWDMDATAGVTFVIPLTLEQIQFVSVIIYNDVIGAGGSMSDIYIGGRWSYVPSTTTLVLARDAGGVFDDIAFNDAGINRGYVNIAYEG